MTQKIYVHANCPDGLASAMILRDAFSRTGVVPPIEFLVHNTPEHRAAGVGGGGLFCDISPHPDAIANGVTRDNTTVLDHHVSSAEIVRSLGGVYSDEPGVSGAVLAYREIWLPIARDYGGDGTLVSCFARAIGARDTWNKSDAYWFDRGQAASAFIMSRPRDEMLAHPPWLVEHEWAIGRALVDQRAELARLALEQCLKRKVRGRSVWIFQDNASGFRLTSDVAEAARALESPPDIMVGFIYQLTTGLPMPSLVFSLRSEVVDVSTIAKAYGGGGHKAAAGFSITTEFEPYGQAVSLIAAAL